MLNLFKNVTLGNIRKLIFIPKLLRELKQMEWVYYSTLGIHYKQIMFIFHMIDKFFLWWVYSMATPTLEFTFTVAHFSMMFHQVSSFKFSLTLWTYEVSMVHMSFHIMTMHMRKSFELFLANRTFIIGKFDISDKLTVGKIYTWKHTNITGLLF